MADDEDAIYVDVVPKLDEAAADEIATSLKDKFKDAAGSLTDSFKDAAPGIKDALKDISKDAYDEFKSGAKDAAKDIGDALIKGDVHGGFERIRDILGNTTGMVSGVGDAFGVHLDSVKEFGKSGAEALNTIEHAVQGFKDTVGGLSDAIHGMGTGGISSRLGSAGSLLDQLHTHLGIGGEGEFGGSLNGTLSQVQSYVQSVQAVKDELKGTQTLVEGLGGGALASGIPEGLAAPLGVIAPPVIAGLSVPPIQRQLQKPGGIRDHFTGPNGGYGANPPGEKGGSDWGYDLLHPWDIPGKSVPWWPWKHDWAGAHPQPTGTEHAPPGFMGGGGSFDLPGGPPHGAGEGGFGAARPATGATSANEVSVSTREAIVSAGSVVLSGGINLGALVGGAAGHWAGGAPGQAPTAAPTASGHLGKWGGFHTGGIIPGFDDGGIVPGGSPGMDNTLGMLPNGRPVGLEGGEGVLNTQAMAQPGMPQAVASANSGASPTQQQSIGHGQGFGVTGGGAIGAAEQAAVMAAAIGGFGGGGIAAEIGVQETNLAIQEAGKAAAIAAMIPSETFSLKGGQMGAPSIGSGGWFSKVAGGLIGQGFNSLNVAGATQPPKQPQPGDTHPGSDPGNGSPQGGGPKPGPSGHPDDPIHTAPAPGTGGATSPMGAANSAMGGMSAMASLGG
jgi:hypothetical protein